MKKIILCVCLFLFMGCSDCKHDFTKWGEPYEISTIMYNKLQSKKCKICGLVKERKVYHR